MRKKINVISGMILLSVLLVLCSSATAADQPATSEAAVVDWVVQSGLMRGVCSVVGCGDGQLVLELARRTELLVHVWDPDTSAVTALRELMQKEGLLGNRVVVEKGSLPQLPYVDNLLDLVIATDLEYITKLDPEEVIRVLRPDGKAILNAKNVNWKTNKAIFKADGPLIILTKPPLEGADNWSHWEHGPDNNPVSTDQVIKAPYMTQWLGLPYYITMPSISTASDGKIFIGMGHIAHHEREEKWLNTLVARNGYNGTVLWKKKFPDGYLAHRSAFIATPDTFYMINLDGDGVLMLDPETGIQKGQIRIPEIDGHWKWIAIQDGVLYALSGKKEDPEETTVVRSQQGHWSWRELSKGYYATRVPWGFGDTLLAYDVQHHKKLWSRKEEKPIDSRAMALGGGKVYFYCPDLHLGCLDAKTGKVDWLNDDLKLRQLIEQKPTKRLESTPGWRSTCYTLYTPKALFYEAQTRNNIVAVSLKDGSYLWHRQKTTNNPNMIYLDGNLLVGIGDGPAGQKGNTLVVNPLTGETIEDLGFRKRSCARLTATADSLFCRGMPEGLTRYDRINKKVMFNAAFRPSCNDGVIGANGLLYFGPWACDCNLSIMGRIALCSAGDFKFDHVATNEERLEVGKGDILNVAPFEVSPKDWPTYRANNQRNAFTQAGIPTNKKQITELWRYQPQKENQATVPTSAGGLIFLGDNNGLVKAIDANTGQLKWTYATAGPIMQPPTIWKGRAYVGSGDGYIYALEAASGRLLWRFRAAPVERRIMVYGSLSSTWPVHSGVLIEDGVAYAAAGIIDYDGTYVYALDAITGKIKWQNGSSGHVNTELRKGVSAQGCLTIAGGRLWMPGGNIVSPASYDLKTGEYLSGDPGNGSVNMGCNRGEDIGVFMDKYIIQGGRLKYSAREDVVNPGKFYAHVLQEDGNIGGPRLFQMGKVTPAWSNDKIILVPNRHMKPACCSAASLEEYYIKGDPKGKQRRHWQPFWIEEKRLWQSEWMADRESVSLALSGDFAVVVCKQDVPRQIAHRWQVCGLHPKNGWPMWVKDLPAPAMMGGLLIDRHGRVVVTLQNGGMICFAKPPKDPAQQQASNN